MIRNLSRKYKSQNPQINFPYKVSIMTKTSVIFFPYYLTMIIYLSICHHLFQQVVWAEQQHEYIRTKRGVHHQRIESRDIQPKFVDPLWDEQWYLVSG